MAPSIRRIRTDYNKRENTSIGLGGYDQHGGYPASGFPTCAKVLSSTPKCEEVYETQIKIMNDLPATIHADDESACIVPCDQPGVIKLI